MLPQPAFGKPAGCGAIRECQGRRIAHKNRELHAAPIGARSKRVPRNGVHGPNDVPACEREGSLSFGAEYVVRRAAHEGIVTSGAGIRLVPDSGGEAAYCV